MSGWEHKPEKYSRVTDKKGFDKNFDQIDWSKKRADLKHEAMEANRVGGDAKAVGNMVNELLNIGKEKGND